ncbi:LppU/SCO3897 family protein [Actinopolyspora mortivallis]|uniref:Uncharacterized protein n=1 Tax=Actinopolyspora mortivallis TaxID=33906 RepID=A0A2T0GR92_ACTMO|nr:hypothetical protein [Actinopolyspora mortivallis]PRW61630.1 hypothetical protein CEP50_19710 [Actinopolyspora mortivallis]
MSTPPQTPDSPEDPSTGDPRFTEESSVAEQDAPAQQDSSDREAADEDTPPPEAGPRTGEDDAAEQKRGGGKLVPTLVTLGVVVLLGAGALFGWQAWKSGALPDPQEIFADAGGNGIATGDCVDISGQGKDEVDFTKAECGSADSDFHVVQRREGEQQCPQNSYDMLLVGENVYCMVPDAVVGDCVVDLEGEKTLMTKVDCSADRASWRVTKVTDKADSEVCPPGAMYLTYPDPARTLCFAELTQQ